jgi:hypothetical protein
MMRFQAILPLVTPALAAATPRSSAPPPEDPCGVASRTILELQAAGERGLIAPSLAKACLLAVPVDVERDLDLISYVRPFVEWQSDLEVLANPPPEYLIPGIDIMHELDRIEGNLKGGFYARQWDFAVDFDDIVRLSILLPMNYRPTRSIPSRAPVPNNVLPTATVCQGCRWALFHSSSPPRRLLLRAVLVLHIGVIGRAVPSGDLRGRGHRQSQIGR